MIDNRNCIDNSCLSPFHPIVFAVRNHSLSRKFTGSWVAGLITVAIVVPLAGSFSVLLSIFLINGSTLRCLSKVVSMEI